MPINFFAGTCSNGAPSEDVTTEATFGLCDDVPRSRAYIDTSRPNAWIAVIDNRNQYEVTFTSIDNCIEIRRPDGTMESRCDGMLTYNATIIFVELKEKNRSWLEDGIGQLETTILLHPNIAYTSQQAYLANSRHPLFYAGRNTRTQEFRDKTGITPLVRNTIELR